MQTRAIILLMLSCTVMLICAASCGAPRQGTITLTVIPEKQEDKISVELEGETAIIQVWSPSGIGGAEVEITSQTLPKRIIFRFHLRGLEGLDFAYDKMVVDGSLSSSSGAIYQRAYNPDNPSQEQALVPTSPYWMEIKDDSKNSTQDGYIEVQAPQDFVTGQHRQCSIHWIDFYR